MNAVVNVLKPPGITSHDVVAWFRKLTGIKRVGHCGTLDPAASGVLVLCVNKATRLLEYMSGWDKEYRAELVLGLITDTQDTAGKVLQAFPSAAIDCQRIVHAVEEMKGEYWQIPPMISARKHQGTPLYKLARTGKEVERKPQRVQIYDIKVLQIKNIQGLIHVMFNAVVSSGTYIRTLCHDLGEKLGCGGTLGFLLRIRVGKFSLAEAFTMEEIESQWKNGNKEFFLSASDSLPDWPAFTLEEKGLRRIANGAILECKKEEVGSIFPCGQKWKLLAPDGELVAIARLQIKANNRLFFLPEKVLV